MIEPDAWAVLAGRGWLAATPAPFRAAVLERSSEHRLRAGEPAWRAGDPPGGIWGLVSGGLAVEVTADETGPHTGYFAAPGTWLGEGPAIHRIPRRVGVTAMQPSRLLHLPLAELDALLAEDPGAWRWIALLSTMATDLAIGIAADLTIRDPRQRVVAVILRTAGYRAGVFPPLDPGEVSLSQERLAGAANVSRTVLSRILGELERAGQVELAYRRIRILDPAGLKRLLAA